MGAEVILFPLAPDDTVESGVEVKEQDYGGCRHHRTVLDVEAHRLRCRDCDQELDPFDWILSFVRCWRRENTLYRQAQQQAREATARLEELKKAERRVKARIRRRGVLLTSKDARIARDQLRALSSAIPAVIREVTGDEQARKRALRRVHLFGFDAREAARVVAVLDDQVECRHRLPAAEERSVNKGES